MQVFNGHVPVVRADTLYVANRYDQSDPIHVFYLNNNN